MLPAPNLWHLPRDASQHGPALDHHLLLNLWIALALLTLAHAILLIGLAIKRRTQPTHKLYLEYLPLALLTILFATLAIKAQHLWSAQRFTGAAPEAMQVEVTAMQFAWYFRYPGPDAHFGHTSLSLADPAAGNPLGLDPHDPHAADDIVTSQLVLPANREVDLTLLSQDVIHGFSVPEMRLKQNAVPGQPTHIHFTPTTPGTYAILCTQLCGLGHYRMAATLLILPPDQFAQWLRTHEQPGATP